VKNGSSIAISEQRRRDAPEMDAYDPSKPQQGFNRLDLPGARNDAKHHETRLFSRKLAWAVRVANLHRSINQEVLARVSVVRHSSTVESPGCALSAQTRLSACGIKILW
jgi:hypothetical protein